MNEHKLWPPLRTTISFDDDEMGKVAVLEHYHELPPGTSTDFKAALQPVVDLAVKHGLRAIISANAYLTRDILEAHAAIETMKRANGRDRLKALGFDDPDEDNFENPPLPVSPCAR